MWLLGGVVHKFLRGFVVFMGKNLCTTLGLALPVAMHRQAGRFCAPFAIPFSAHKNVCTTLGLAMPVAVDCILSIKIYVPPFLLRFSRMKIYVPPPRSEVIPLVPRVCPVWFPCCALAQPIRPNLAQPSPAT